MFWASLFLAILSTIPFSSGLQKSDGRRLWQLLRYPRETQRFRALIAIQTEEAQGLRPQEWSAQLVNEMLDVDASANEYLTCQLLLFYRLLDEGNEWAALSHLENAVAKSAKAGDMVRSSLFLEAACACARIKNDSHKARVWRERALPLIRKKPDVLEAVDASIAMSGGRHDEALELWQAARARLVRGKLDSGLSRLALHKWEESEGVCREQIAAGDS